MSCFPYLRLLFADDSHNVAPGCKSPCTNPQTSLCSQQSLTTMFNSNIWSYLRLLFADNSHNAAPGCKHLQAVSQVTNIVLPQYHHQVLGATANRVLGLVQGLVLNGAVCRCPVHLVLVEALGGLFWCLFHWEEAICIAQVVSH